MRKDKFWFFLVKLLPRNLRYYVTVDSIAKATTGQFSNTNVAELNAMTVLERI